MRSIGLLAGAMMLMVLAYGQAHAQTAKAELHDTQGKRVGSLTLTQEADGVRVAAEVSGLPPGFHGFHIHAVGKCEPPFKSAGGHFNPAGQNHPHHAGDLPNLLVNADGKAYMVVKTDRFKVVDLFDARTGAHSSSTLSRTTTATSRTGIARTQMIPLWQLETLGAASLVGSSPNRWVEEKMRFEGAGGSLLPHSELS